MITLDTNVLARYLVKDDPEQAKIAAECIASNECLLLSVVALETVWVLESAYGYTPAQVIERLLHVLGLPTVLAESYPALMNALDWYAGGMDFADALHVALSEQHRSKSFTTFDKGIVNAVARLGIRQPVTLLRKN